MRELQANEEYQYDADELDELEQLEEGNMFDEPIDMTQETSTEPEAVTPDEVTDGLGFAESYSALSDAGMSHDAIMERLSED